MSQPQYFLPDVRAEQLKDSAQLRAVLAERGLTDVFADVPQDQIATPEVIGRGPGDKSGVILCYHADGGRVPKRLGYYPKDQEWSEVGDGSLLWIGIEPAEPPTPEDIARRTQYSGYLLELADGRKWQIPVIRRPDDTTELPRNWRWDPTGRVIEPIKPAYVSFWQETAEPLEWLMARYRGEGIPPEAGSFRSLELCVRALSLNYRFGRNEQNILGPIDRDNFLSILSLTVDFPRFDELRVHIEKKRAAQLTRNSGAGQTDASQHTAPAAAS